MELYQKLERNNRVKKIFLTMMPNFLLQSSYAISPSAVFLSLMSVIVWFIFGLTRNIKPLIYANIFGFIGMCLIILGILLYHD